MTDVWKSNFNIGNYFMPITLKPAPAPTPAGYRRKIVCITKAKVGATEGFIEINDFEDVEDYTANTEVFALEGAGMSQIFLCNVLEANIEDIEEILNDNLTKFFTVAITSDFTDEEKAEIVIPTAFNGGITTNFTTLSLATTFSGGINQGASCDKDMYNFLLMIGKVLVNQSGWFNNYGAGINRVGYLRTNPQDYLDKKVSFIITNSENGVNRIGGLFLGGRPFTTPYILDEIKVGLQDKWIAYRIANSIITASELNCALTESELMEFLGTYVQTDDRPNLPLSSADIKVFKSAINDFAFTCEIEISKLTDIIQLLTMLTEVA